MTGDAPGIGVKILHDSSAITVGPSGAEGVAEPGASLVMLTPELDLGTSGKLGVGPWKKEKTRWQSVGLRSSFKDWLTGSAPSGCVQ
ncbi:hypothetical protein [Kribbella sp. NBC_00889]|uniref:hypothetical protein n=1 Tax=Kribbella sp. NBC_00889 TaxID=2975974 RepID=UPI00386FDCAD|nr:hypothetical protein OG817_08395 [Kribbella sp. NBC_00889]